MKLIKKKLVLHKETIAGLNSGEMGKIFAGEDKLWGTCYVKGGCEQPSTGYVTLACETKKGPDCITDDHCVC